MGAGWQHGWGKPAIKAAAAGLGVAVAGPLGGALGGLLGEAVGGHAAKLIATYAEKFGDKAGEKLLEMGSDSLIERLKGEGPGLEGVYREALRVSLAAVRGEVGGGYEDWFVHWEVSLAGEAPLRLEAVRAEQLVPEELNGILRSTLVRLDGLGAMRPEALTFYERAMPEVLLVSLGERLPERLEESFGALIVSEKYAVAWKEAERAFQAESLRLLREVKEDTSAIRTDTSELIAGMNELLRRTASAAVDEGRLTEVQARAQTAEAEAEEWKKKYLEVVRANPSLQELLASGDFEGAARRKEEQIARQKSDQAQSYFELGTIEELRFDWAKALEAYREAWRLDGRTEYGFKVAYCAQKQNRFVEAIGVYEVLRGLYVEAADVATMLNNLGLLYRDTQRMREAEAAYGEALSIRRRLAAVNAEAYLPDVAMTLNNLAILYSATQRMREAEAAYGEALSIRRGLAAVNAEAYLPDVAMTLNNLAILYRATQRMREAEAAYVEALSIRRGLAAVNAEAYLPDVAMTLNNLAVLYRATQRLREAEAAYGEALSIRRKLAAVNAEAYLPDVAMTLNNLANLYSDTQRMREAEAAYGEALSIRRKLAAINAEAYLPDVAGTLNNLANFYSATQRLREAEAAYGEALSIRRKLAAVNAEAYLPYVAGTLNNLGLLYSATQRLREAEAAYGEALSVYRGLAAVNAEAYLPYVAGTLNNLAVLYSATQRMREAEGAYGEALSIRCGLAAVNAEAYLPDVAMTLNNLAVLYLTMEEVEEGERCCAEAEAVLEPFWQANPAVHGSQLARILGTRALLGEAMGWSAAELCALVRRALGMSYDAGVRAGIQGLVERFCGGGEADASGALRNNTE